VPAGRIADHWGRKRVLLLGVALFTATSAVAAGAPNLGVLVGARAVQAVGAAMIVPTSLGLLYPNFPRRQHTLVVGIWAGVGAVAASTGPPVGGLLVTLDWRWIFLINVPIGIGTVVAGVLLLPEARQAKGSALPDPASAVTLLAAVSLLVLGMFPGLILVGLAGGLSQAPMVAAAGTLAPERATTGGAVLDMSRQIGGAVGVAVLVALVARPTVTGFDHAWWVQGSAGLAAAATLLALRSGPGPEKIEDYAPTAGAMREAAASLNHAQPGDPAKAARAIVEMAAAAEPPLRLQLGTDTLQAVQAKLDGVRAEMDASRHVGAGTDHA
jgi:MFS family permease